MGVKIYNKCMIVVDIRIGVPPLLSLIAFHDCVVRVLKTLFECSCSVMHILQPTDCKLKYQLDFPVP